MKRRLSYAASLVVLADLLVLGAVWRLAPALSVTVALAVPSVEPMLAPLYAEPALEEVAVDVSGLAVRADLYRPARALAGLVLVHGAVSRERDVDDLARLLARRNIAVVVPRAPDTGTTAPMLTSDYARTLPVPLRVASLHRFRDEGTASASVLDRAGKLWRLFRLASEILAP
jgi:hypothetical protein